MCVCVCVRERERERERDYNKQLFVEQHFLQNGQNFIKDAKFSIIEYEKRIRKYHSDIKNTKDEWIKHFQTLIPNDFNII